MADCPNTQSTDTNQQNLCECGDAHCNYVQNLQAAISWLKKAAANVRQEQR